MNGKCIDKSNFAGTSKTKQELIWLYKYVVKHR